MLREILHTLSVSPVISDIVLVSGDRQVLEMGEEYGAVPVVDHDESGVNQAVSLADRHTAGSDASLVLPQDIPFIKTQDIDFLLRFVAYPKCCIVVPSRRFDGTNALFRMPADIIKTYYDQDSYRMHMQAAKQATSNSILIFVKRIMMDIDTVDDLKYCISQNQKPDLCEKLAGLVSSNSP